MGPDTRLFKTSPCLCDAINRGMVQSEIEGGVDLRNLPEGSVVLIETQNRTYTMVNYGKGAALLHGHPEFCPEPVLVTIHGSTWGGAVLKYCFIGRGMQLEFRHPAYERPIITSVVKDIREQPASRPARLRNSDSPRTAQPPSETEL
jgi:hypothetical protein